LPLVYDELRKLAAAKLANWPDTSSDRAGARRLPSPGGCRQSPTLGQPPAFLFRRSRGDAEDSRV